jgi:hypothetical protein
MVIIVTTLAILAIGAVAGTSVLAYKGGKAAVKAVRNHKNNSGGGLRGNPGQYPTT